MKAQSGFLGAVVRIRTLSTLAVALSALGAIHQAFGQWSEQVLATFGYGQPSGYTPSGPLLEGSDGQLYGVNKFGPGTIYKIRKDGSEFCVLRAPAGSPDGAYPVGGLIQLKNGILYGTTMSGGQYASGTVFSLSTNGSSYAVLFSFGAAADDGSEPSGLTQGPDGTLYGTTGSGGLWGCGTAYQILPDGTGYRVLYTFGTTSGDGWYPREIIQAVDGDLYGVTPQGGANGYGTIFKIRTNGTHYAVLHTFGGTTQDGRSPYGKLMQGLDGMLYGTTFGSGPIIPGGTVYKINPDGTGYTLIHNFTLSEGPNKPQAGLVQGSNGILYGTTSAGGPYGRGTIFAMNTNGADYGVLYNFGTSSTDGNGPQEELIQSLDGTLFGTTYWGLQEPVGTVFRVGKVPTILLQPLSRTNFAGTTAVLSVTSSGAEPLSFEWRKNGAALADGNHTEGASGPVLSLSKLSANDAGNYSVAITNWAGSAMSDTATLTVLPSPQIDPPLFMPDGTLRLRITAPTNLNCRVDLSSNLVDWVVLTNLPNPSGTMDVFDRDNSRLGQRFYRAVNLLP